MRWRGRRQSENVEDRRGRGPGLLVGGGLGTVAIVLLVMLLGGDPSALLDQLGGGGASTESGGAPPAQDDMGAFVATVLADTEDVWTELFREQGRTYRVPTLVRFSGRVSSACGLASAAVGPFYCPADDKVYLDTSFYDKLAERLGAPGDFAQAYVLAHEVGHHVQNLLGISERVRRLQERADEVEANRLSVRLELQADFFAGVWAHHAQQRWNILEPGDVKEALDAASAIGDDRLQRSARGTVVPDSFTHGTSAQRVAWFRHGLETGDMTAGDTFDDAVFDRVSPR
jgi:uncharacterized protein